jgi:hypothetical protein
MKIYCSHCAAKIIAEDMNLSTGWAKCRACDNLFEISSVVEGFTTSDSNQNAEPVPERPFDAETLIKRTPEELFLHQPAKGMNGGAWGLVGFAVMWNGFIAFWTFGALGGFSGEFPSADELLFAAFSLPFWCVGIGLIISIIVITRAQKSLLVNPVELSYRFKCLSFERTKVIPRETIQHARKGKVFVTTNHEDNSTTPSLPIDIVHKQGAVTIKVSETDERDWLIHEINDYLKNVPADSFYVSNYDAEPYPTEQEVVS